MHATATTNWPWNLLTYVSSDNVVACIEVGIRIVLSFPSVGKLRTPVGALTNV